MFAYSEIKPQNESHKGVQEDKQLDLAESNLLLKN